MRRLLPFLSIFSCVFLLPSSAFATDLLTAGGFKFDLQDGVAPAFGRDGTFSDGTMDAYDGGYRVTLNGTGYSPPSGTPTTSLAGRQVEMPVQTIGSLTLQRFVYVPSTGGDYARILDIIVNTSTTAQTAMVAYDTNLGSDGSESVMFTASGDTSCTTADNWCESDVSVGSSFMMDPSIGSVFQGDGATVRVATQALGSGDNAWTFNFMVPASGRAALLTFAIQKDHTMPSLVRDEAMRLVTLPDDAMVGLDDYLGDIVNFQSDTAGAPRIRFMGPTTANEGDGADITLSVIDVGGASTWSWDVNGDGTFGDMPGATMVSIPAGTTDGPSTVRVGVQAMNSTATSTRYRTVQVTNVAPTVDTSGANAPPLSTSNGADFHYQIVATDPAGALDPLTYTCTMCPGSMTVSATGYVQWTPGDLDVTMPMMPHHIVVTVDDGDMGTTDVAWDLAVLPNHPPSRPSILYPNGITVDGTPRLVAGNSSDMDGDPLSYVFELDTVTTFDSAAKQTSPPVPETDGFTAWRPMGLATGTLFYWRVKANDTMADSEWASASFYTSGPPAVDAGVPDSGPMTDAGARDAGGGGGGRGGCCATAPGAGSGPGLAVLLGALGLAVVRRRRR